MDSSETRPSSMKSYRKLPIQENGEALTPLTTVSPRIKVFPYYFQHGVPNACEDCYVREGVAERLKLAVSFLPEELQLIVLDGWRPYEVQLALYKQIKREVIKEHPQATEAQILDLLHTFVARPSQNVESPSPHMSGGAVDVTLGNHREWLEMGTAFDEISERAKTLWYEEHALQTEAERKIRDNRRLLLHCMTHAGFVNYEEEWWHFDFGNQRWAMLTGQTAIYKGIVHL